MTDNRKIARDHAFASQAQDQPTPQRYGWTWYMPEDDPDERGTAWIEIGPVRREGGIDVMDGDCLCEIICRDYENIAREHPDWIENKEAAAKLIVKALNELDTPVGSNDPFA